MRASPEHEVVYQDLIALIRKHGDTVSAVEILAIAANMLGKLIGMQDQRVLSSDQALKIVTDNIQAGNQQIREEIMNSKGSA